VHNGTTFWWHPVCCAAALATLDIVEKSCSRTWAKMGDRLITGARKLQDKYAAIGDVRGRGLMVGVEFVKGPRNARARSDIPHEIVGRAFKKGLCSSAAGRAHCGSLPAGRG